MPEKGWKKNDILPTIDSPAYKKLLDEIEQHVKNIEAQKPKLAPDYSTEDFLKILQTQEKIADIATRLSAYAYLWFSENTSDQHAKSYMATVDQLNVTVSNRTMFFGHWFKDLDEKNAQRIITAMPNEYQYMLRFLRILKPHTLTEAEEKIINTKDITGINAVFKLYEIITTNFMFTLTVDGKKRELGREQLSNYVRDHRANVRKAAYQELYRVYKDHSDVLNEIYRNILLDWKNEHLDLRKHTNPISVRNKGNDVSDKTVQTLLNVCRKNTHIFQEYFKIKAKLCGIKKMTRYDLYAPYKEKKKKYSYADAQKMVYAAYNAYSPKMRDLAKNVIDAQHVDYATRKNKITGAYCMDITPNLTPYVLLNHEGDIRDVFTMAHELGHAVHDQLAAQHSILTMHAPLVLAETASIFGEMLLFDSLMQQTNDKELKKTLIIQQLDNIYASVIRQAYFVLYEIQAHDLVAKGANLHTLNKAYLDNLKEQFGTALSIPEEFQYEWTSIPHIYDRPFYCYAYAFGNLLVLALYEQYRTEGKSFVPKYLKILGYGGSEQPAKILKEVGIDIEDEKFWQSGFNLINEMFEQLKALR